MLRFRGIDNRMKITQVRGLYFNHILNGGGLNPKLPFWIGLVYEPVNFIYVFQLPTTFYKKKCSQTINKIIVC